MSTSIAPPREIRIVAYESRHAEAFDRLNREWLEAFALMEPPDRADLADPEQAFLANGGAIFVAEEGDATLGVCALRRGHDGCFEIAKLAVDSTARRRGVARRLLRACIAAARQRQAERLVLVSSSCLTAAVALYESLGFRHEPVPGAFSATYETADIYMTLDVKEPAALTTARSLLATTPATLDAWLRALPAHMIDANEGGETWSPFAVVGHLIHGEKTDWMPRLRLILDHGESRAFEPFDRFAQFKESEGRTLAQLLDEFAHLRRENLSALADLHLTAADLERRGRHPALGPVTASELLSTWVAHDLDHIVQIARVLAFQYRDAVGPWRQYLRVISGAQG